MPWLNLRLKPAEVHELKAGDIVHINIERSIASSERRVLIDAWNSVMAKVGHEDDVTLFLTAGEKVDMKVYRPTLVDGKIELVEVG